MKVSDFIPPIALKVRNRLRLSLSANDSASALVPRACHFQQAFFTSGGDVYPCCRVWGRDDLRVGRLDDPEIVEKLRSFDKKCSCETYRLVKAMPGENFNGSNVEFSLSCQGECAMCCVYSPEHKGDKYKYFDQVKRLFDQLSPKHLTVQGGEILIQKETLRWLEAIKEKNPSLQMSLVTNGNVDVKMVPLVERLFQSVCISFVGFQPQTYRTIMGMDVTRAISFAEELSKSTTARVILKFLVTPLNIHEAGIFLEWSMDSGADECTFQTSNPENQIQMESDYRYWEKIIARSSADLKRRISKNAQSFAARGFRVSFDDPMMAFYGINTSFIASVRPIVVRWGSSASAS